MQVHGAMSTVHPFGSCLRGQAHPLRYALAASLCSSYWASNLERTRLPMT